MESMVSEKISVQEALAIQSIATAKQSSYIGLKGSLRVRCVVRAEVAAGDLVLIAKEAKDSVGTAAQNLVINLPSIQKVDGFAAVRVASNGTATVTVTALNGAAGYAIIEVEGADLSEGFTHFGLSVNGSAARNGGATFEAETEYKPAYSEVL